MKSPRVFTFFDLLRVLCASVVQKIKHGPVEAHDVTRSPLRPLRPCGKTRPGIEAPRPVHARRAIVTRVRGP